jgi:hypothetical protein
MISNDVFSKLKPQRLSEVTQDIKTGDLLLCSGSGLISDAIKKATDSVFSHVALLLQLPISDQWLVLESVESFGVRCVTLKEGYLSNYLDTGKSYPGNILVARHEEVQKQESQFEKLYKTAFSLTGDKYNEQDIFQIANRIALNEIGIDESGHLLKNNCYICSEYVYVCLKSIGINLPYDPRGFIAPGTIASLDQVMPVASLQ